jgi:hypothetical protein
VPLLNARRYFLSLSCALLLTGCEDPGGPSRDRGAPEIRLLSPLVSDTSVQLTEIGLVGEIYDSVGVARVTYQINDGPEVESPITPGSIVRFTPSEEFHAPLLSGSNTIWLRAYDEAGNRAETIFAGAFGSGAALVQALHVYRGEVCRGHRSRPKRRLNPHLGRKRRPAARHAVLRRVLLVPVHLG